MNKAIVVIVTFLALSPAYLKADEILAKSKLTHLTCSGTSTINMKSGASAKPQANTIHVSIKQTDKRTTLIWAHYEHDAIISNEWYEYHYNKQDNISTPTYGIALNRYNMSITTVQAYNDKELSSVIFEGVCNITDKPMI